MSGSVEILAIVTPKPGKADRVESLLTEVVNHSLTKEPGTLRYQLQRELGTQNPRFFVIETYKDKASFAAHKDNGPLKAMGQASVKENLMAAPVEVLRTSTVAGMKGKL